VRAFVFVTCFVFPFSLAAQGTKSPAANAQQQGQAKAAESKAPATKAPDSKAPQTKAANTKAGGATVVDTKVTDATAAQQSKSAPADTKARPGNTRPLPGNTRPLPSNTRPVAPRPGTDQSNRPAITVAPEADPRTAIAPIMREAYDYDAAGRRDPFLSLLNSEDLRPMISDLRLVSILYDESGRRPIAVMRDVQNNTQYRVTTGSTLGRLKVALIKRKAVIFSIEEFGMNRQDSLVLGDTTKARTR
jgi:hypothetical protein